MSAPPAVGTLLTALHRGSCIFHGKQFELKHLRRRCPPPTHPLLSSRRPAHVLKKTRQPNEPRVSSLMNVDIAASLRVLVVNGTATTRWHFFADCLGRCGTRGATQRDTCQPMGNHATSTPLQTPAASSSSLIGCSPAPRLLCRSLWSRLGARVQHQSKAKILFIFSL